MVVFAGQGDPRRSMGLLWRSSGPEPVRPGPKPALSLNVIIDTAVEVADADGLAAVSMRAIGERLGRTGMALYTYVPNKTELLDLMYDRVLAELPADYPLEDGWRAALALCANDIRGCYLRHPWVLQISQARPILGPHEFALRDTVAGVLRGTGLRPAMVRAALSAVLYFVQGAARTIAEARQAAAATGATDDEWWLARAGELAEVAPDLADRFPMAVWIESEREEPSGGEELPYLERGAEESFAAGLAVLLDGIEARVRNGSGDSS